MGTHDRNLQDTPLGRMASDSWGWLLGLGVVQIITGVVAVVWPGITVLALGIILGIYLIVSGIVMLVSVFAPDTPGLVRAMYALGALLSIPLGLACLRDELQSVVFLAIWIGVAWLVIGIARLVASLSGPAGMPGRGLTGLSGVLMTIGGVVFMIWPIGSVATFAWVSGIFLIVAGLCHIVEAIQVRKVGSAST